MSTQAPRKQPPFAGLSQAGEDTLGRRVALYLSVAVMGVALGLALTRQPLVLVIGALAGLIAVIVVMIKPYWGVLFYVVIFATRIGEVYPVLAQLHLERIVGALTLVALFAQQIRRNGALSLDGSKQTQMLLLVVLAALLSVPFAYWRAAAVDGCVEFSRILGFYIILVHLVDSRRRLHIVVVIFWLASVYLGATSLFKYFGGGAVFRQGIERATGTTSAAGNYNELGTTLASAFPLFYLLATGRFARKARFLAAGACAILVVTLVVTGSRASLLGFLAGATWLWWHSRRRALFGVLGLAALIVGFSLLPDQYQQRYATIASAATGGSVDGSSQGRLQAWMAGLQIAAERPLFGAGINCYSAANRELSGSWLNAHSLYFQVLGELGLFGCVTFFGLLVTMLRLNRDTRAALAPLGESWAFETTVLKGVFAGLIVLLVSGVFGHSLLRRTWYVFAAVDLVVLRLYLQSLPTRTPPQSG